MQTRAENLIGQKFNKLTIVREHDRVQAHNCIYIIWECLCDCGNTCYARSRTLKSNHKLSCGCYQPERGTHRMSDTKLWYCWRSMRNRCNCEQLRSYKNYGGRGIKVCDRWNESFENFYADMGPTYKEGLSLERIDVNGNYCPENCCWIPKVLQAKNTRKSVFLIINGEKKLLVDWCKIYGISEGTVRHRIADGFSHEDALFIKPVMGAKYGASLPVPPGKEKFIRKPKTQNA